MPDQPQADQRQEKGGVKQFVPAKSRPGWMTAPVIAGAVFVGGFAMAERLADAQLQENLDRYYPLIEPSADPPGRWQAYDNGQSGQKWTGETRWSIRYGGSIVRLGYGKPEYVTKARLADGTRVNADSVGDGWRYQISDGPRRWVHGTIDIRPDDVIFTPGEQPKYTAPTRGDHPSFYADLAGDNALRERLLDDDFADAVYAYLKNEDFFKEGGERIWSNGLSDTAGFIADLRGQGDVYTDYYPHGGRAPLDDRAYAARRTLGEPELAPEEVAFEAALTARFAEIKTILATLGWRRATAEDRDVAALATRRDLASWEARSAGGAPDWISKIQATQPPPPGAIRLRSVHPNQMTAAERDRDEEITTQALPKRLYALATSGRISEIEYREMVTRIRHIP
jgi:hypothetical protein